MTGDAASEADVEKLFAAAVQDDDIGVPDVLVNNAGGAVSMVPMVESEIDAWWGDVVSFPFSGSTFPPFGFMLPVDEGSGMKSVLEREKG